MRASAAKEKTLHRRARGQALVPHMCGQTLALENMPTTQTHPLFNIGRPHHLDINYRCGNITTETANRRQRQFAYFRASTVPIALGKSIGHILGENAHDVQTLGRHTGIMRGLEIQLGPQSLGQLARPGRGKTSTPFVLRKRRINLPPVVRRIGSGPGYKVR